VLELVVVERPDEYQGDPGNQKRGDRGQQEPATALGAGARTRRTAPNRRRGPSVVSNGHLAWLFTSARDWMEGGSARPWAAGFRLAELACRGRPAGRAGRLPQHNRHGTGTHVTAATIPGIGCRFDEVHCPP
jgi:hypothetical protein